MLYLFGEAQLKWLCSGFKSDFLSSGTSPVKKSSERTPF